MSENATPSTPSTPSTPTNGKAIAALVLGIVSIVFCWAYVGVAAGIVGLILGISAKKEMPSGMATAGIVLSIIGLAIGGIWIISCLACTSCAATLPWSSFGRFY